MSSAPPNSVILALDAGTSSARALLFDRAGKIVGLHRQRLITSRPKPGYAEMDANDIFAAVDHLVAAAVAQCDQNGWHIEAIGLSSQRSSFLLVDGSTGAPVSPVISWQDRRAAPLMERFTHAADTIEKVTGLPPSPHFGGPKLAWLIGNDSALPGDLAGGRKIFITLSTAIVAHLTGSSNRGNLLLDESIAGRTLCYNLAMRRWDNDLCDLFGWPEAARPRVVPTRYHYGTTTRYGEPIPLRLSIGDQQAAMAGLGAMSVGETAINLGTSGSVLVNTGQHVARADGLLSSIAWSTDESADYLLEGTINAVGALFRWFGEIENRPELAESWSSEVAVDGGTETPLMLVPGINGLAAPYWRADLETTYFPESADHLLTERLRAGMLSIALLTADIIETMNTGDDPAGSEAAAVHCGGGMAQPPLLQALADLLGRPIFRHSAEEATARGVAVLLAHDLGWNDFGEGENRPPGHEQIVPTMDAARRDYIRATWKSAVAHALGI